MTSTCPSDQTTRFLAQSKKQILRPSSDTTNTGDVSVSHLKPGVLNQLETWGVLAVGIPIAFHFGRQWFYQNLSYGLVALSVENAFNNVMSNAVLLPIIGLGWGFLVKCLILYNRSVHLGISWFEVCQTRDMSEIFRNSYWTSVIMMGVNCKMILLVNYFLYKFNQMSNGHIFSNTVGQYLLVPGTLAVVGLMGLLVVTETWYNSLHMLFAKMCFSCFTLYFLFTSLAFASTLWRFADRASLQNILTASYLMVIPFVMFWCICKWRDSRRVAVGDEVGDEYGRIYTDKKGSTYEWIAVILIYMWYIGLTPVLCNDMLNQKCTPPDLPV